MTTLEKEILDIINETTDSEYIGKLKVIIDDISNNDKLYTLGLYLNFEMSPMVLSYQGTEEEFKNFIREEMKSRKLQKVFRYEVIRDILLPGMDEYEDEEE
jgi:hypothetical protein